MGSRPSSRSRRHGLARAAGAVTFVLGVSAPLGASAQAVLVGSGAPVRYEISFENRAHHEAKVRIRYTDLDPSQPLALRMSRTSPGRYALHEFAKNVYAVEVTGPGGAPLEVERPNPHEWRVPSHGGEVVVTYTLFADRADGTYSGIDETHAHLNVPATFMWARGLFERPVEVTVRLPEGSGWKVATQLAPTGDPHVWTAPTHHYFLDSPIEASDFVMREWNVGGQTIRVAVHHDGSDEEVDEYARLARRIVDAETEVFGELPTFDFGTYTFLACYLPWVSGDGMEHRNSTVLTSTGSLRRSMVGLLGTVAHEFFHAWNIERLRPASLEPFDFEAANMSGALWFGEGFTSYYDDLALVRSEVISVSDFARRIGGSINGVLTGPGRFFFSPVEMSMQAPFVDAATSVDPTNRANTFISYYTWGSVIGLGLDLELRQRFPRLTLDDVMRWMWERHGEPERPFTVDDIERALAEVSGDPDFAADFFARFVHGHEVPDFASLLPAAGFELRSARPGQAFLGFARMEWEGGGFRVTESTEIGTPLYEAGVDVGDLVLSVGGRTVDEPGELELALEGRAPGEMVEIVYRSRAGEKSATVPLIADPSVVVVPVEDSGGALDEGAAAFRRAWIGS